MKDLSYLIPLRDQITKRPHLAELASVVLFSENFTAMRASCFLARTGSERWNLSASAWEVVLSGPSGAFDVASQAARAASAAGAPEARARRMFYLVVLEILAKGDGVSVSTMNNMRTGCRDSSH